MLRHVSENVKDMPNVIYIVKKTANLYLRILHEILCIRKSQQFQDFATMLPNHEISKQNRENYPFSDDKTPWKENIKV